MTYVGTCPECGKRVALHVKDPWELTRHGYNQGVVPEAACLGSGHEPVFGTVSYQQSGRRVEQPT